MRSSFPVHLLFAMVDSCCALDPGASARSSRAVALRGVVRGQQVALAFAMGLFMSLRLLLGGSLWECAVLHVVNNCTAALFPPGELPGGSTGALLTLFAYMLLNAKLSRVLRREADKAE